MENKEKATRFNKAEFEEFVSTDLRGNPVALHKTTDHPGHPKAIGPCGPFFSSSEKKIIPPMKSKGNLVFFADVNTLSNMLKTRLAHS